MDPEQRLWEMLQEQERQRREQYELQEFWRICEIAEDFLNDTLTEEQARELYACHDMPQSFDDFVLEHIDRMVEHVEDADIPWDVSGSRRED